MTSKKTKRMNALRQQIRTWTRLRNLTFIGAMSSVAALGMSVILAPTGASPDDPLGKVPIIGLVAFIIAMTIAAMMMNRSWCRFLRKSD